MIKGMKTICGNPECQRVFYAKSTVARYCSDKCRKRGHYLARYAGKSREMVQAEIEERRSNPSAKSEAESKDDARKFDLARTVLVKELDKKRKKVSKSSSSKEDAYGNFR